MKEELDKIDNINIQEGSMYSDKYKVAGQVDCIAEYDGKPCVIDFKTSTREKKEEWVENYFIQGTAYAEMYEERYGVAIEDILILVVTEQGINQVFKKKKHEYIPKLIEAIDNFHGNNNS
jgi:genome maintenance exonuclease 1